MLYFNLVFTNKSFHSVLRKFRVETQSVFIVTEYFTGFPYFLQANCGFVLKIMLRPLYYSLIIPCNLGQRKGLHIKRK